MTTVAGIERTLGADPALWRGMKRLASEVAASLRPIRLEAARMGAVVRWVAESAAGPRLLVADLVADEERNNAAVRRVVDSLEPDEPTVGSDVFAVYDSAIANEKRWEAAERLAKHFPRPVHPTRWRANIRPRLGPSDYFPEAELYRQTLGPRVVPALPDAVRGVPGKRGVPGIGDLGRVHELFVPEWGVWVRLRSLTPSDLADLAAKPRRQDVLIWIVGRALVNESGERLFTDEEIPLLGKKSYPAIRRIAHAVLRSSGASSLGGQETRRRILRGLNNLVTEDLLGPEWRRAGDLVADPERPEFAHEAEESAILAALESHVDDAKVLALLDRAALSPGERRVVLALVSADEAESQRAVAERIGMKPSTFRVMLMRAKRKIEPLQ